MLYNSYQKKKKKKEAEFVGLGQSQKTISGTKPSLVYIHWPVYPCKRKTQKLSSADEKNAREETKPYKYRWVCPHSGSQWGHKGCLIRSAVHILNPSLEKGSSKFCTEMPACCSLTRIIHSTHTLLWIYPRFQRTVGSDKHCPWKQAHLY